MPLKFPGAWRFKPPQDSRFANRTIPGGMVAECVDLIMKVATQGNRQEVLEHFKGYFCAASGATHYWSSSASWAETDLWTYAQEAAVNAPPFIEALYDACESFRGEDTNVWVPDAEMINEVLSKHGVGYAVKPPHLDLREDTVPVVPVVAPPPTLTERAADILGHLIEPFRPVALTRKRA